FKSSAALSVSSSASTLTIIFKPPSCMISLPKDFDLIHKTAAVIVSISASESSFFFTSARREPP
ncbi:MAG: hypothetical protein IJL12_04460, partial [Selenomonadaceae bacterium]|nr:hypothetical protein [Selenomonadaceae bacterium]